MPIALLLSVLMVVVGILLSFQSSKAAMYWVFGGCFGFILQKSRFCFTASMRDPVLTGTTSLTKAVLIAFAIATIGFTAIKYRDLSSQSALQPYSAAFFSALAWALPAAALRER